jgi:hypothetical protein
LPACRQTGEEQSDEAISVFVGQIAALALKARSQWAYYSRMCAFLASEDGDVSTRQSSWYVWMGEVLCVADNGF